MYTKVGDPFETYPPPVFTKTLAPGLGVAEDPGYTESFGQHRCRLLAEGLVRGHEQRIHNLEDRLRVVSDCFRAEGLDLDPPFLIGFHLTFTRSQSNGSFLP